MTNNSFANFLLDPFDDGLYDMLNQDLRWEAYTLFTEPVFYIGKGEQYEILEVAGPIFSYELGDHGKKLYSGIEFGSNVDHKIRLTLGDLLAMDWYTDEFIFYDHIPQWCLWPTYELIRDITIKLVNSNMEYTVTLKANDGGFTKYSYSWKKISRPVSFVQFDCE